MDRKSDYLPPVARILLAAIFLISGLGKIAGWNETTEMMSTMGMPLAPLLLAAAIVVEVAGGLALIIGYRARLAATLMFLYLIPTTLLFHGFWAFEGLERQIQLVNFLKNLSIMGGLLAVSYWGAGPFSIDARSRVGTRTGLEAQDRARTPPIGGRPIGT